MRRCNGYKDCKIKTCLHHENHFWRYLDYDNNCEAPCDVVGGVAGAYCEELPCSYVSPITGELFKDDE